MSIFTQSQLRVPKASSFGLSHDVKLTCHAGYLIPIVCLELLPGDTIEISNVVMARLAPMISPIMHKMDISITHHAVPVRLLWPSGYEKFFEHAVPDETTPVAPYFSDVEINVGDLGDYLGLPTVQWSSADDTEGQYSTIDKISALPYAAYQKIYNDWYRDQNLVNSGNPYPDELTDGLNNFNDFNHIRRRAWQHDYFTAALPFAQKGEAVEVPIGVFDDVTVYKTPSSLYPNDTHWNIDGRSDPSMTDLTTSMAVKEPTRDGGIEGDYYADTSSLGDASAITINSLRWAVRIQEFLEANARGGTRYVELVRHRFGVKSSDARLFRSEFLGWSSNPVVISEVLTTAETNTGTTGEMAGHGLSVGSSKKIKYYSEENGFFMTMLCIRPKTSYQQGIHRMWSRFSNLDYAYPHFAHLGEQEVLNREIYYGDDELNDDTFGYMQRYAEYKYMNDRVCGQFRTTLDTWHMARKFPSRPHLNQGFIECNPTTRVFAVSEETPYTHHYWINVANYIKMWRKLPKHGIPTL